MTLENTASLNVKDLYSGYGEFVAIRDISLSVGKGEIVSVIGPNGAGKTTLLKTIIGILKPKRGEIYFNGTKISGQSPRHCAKVGIGYVPQGAGIFPQMTVKENIEAGAYVLNDSKLYYNCFPGLAKELITELFP